MAPIIAKIQRYANKQVAFLDFSDNVIALLSPYCEVRRNAQQNGFRVFDNASGKSVLIFVENLTDYKLDPAAWVSFSGTLWQWWSKFTTLFFPIAYPNAIAGEIVNDSGVAGGTVTDALNALSVGVPAYPKTAAAGTYNVLVTDFHIYITANNTNVVLPLIGANLDREYVIWVGNFTGCTLTCNVADNIIGEVSQDLPAYTSVTAKTFIANQYLIG